jgi:tetratricopeptide (TPR) repeat protein
LIKVIDFQIADLRSAVMSFARYKEAVNDCDDALQQDSTLIKLHIRKGRCLVKLGHLNAADEAFSRVLEYHVRDLLAGGSSEIEREDMRQLLETQKGDAKIALREIDKLRVSVRNLIVLEGQQNHVEVLKTTAQILSLSPYYRAAQIAKANALVELLRCEEAKAYCEESTLRTHPSIQMMFAHSNFVFPCPLQSTLRWVECKEGSNVLVDTRSVASFLLCIGSEMSAVYMCSLKNIDAVRSYCADVMQKVSSIFSELLSRLGEEDRRDAWAWAVEESKRVMQMISLKNTADKQFKSQDYRGSLYSYGCALKVAMCYIVCFKYFTVWTFSWTLLRGSGPPSCTAIAQRAIWRWTSSWTR